MRNYKEVGREFPRIVTIEDSIEGQLIRVNTGNTKFGEAEFLTLKTDTETVSLIVNAGLKKYQWLNYIGKYIMIKYTGEKTNPKNKRKFKSYALFVDESAPEDEEIPF